MILKIYKGQLFRKKVFIQSAILSVLIVFLFSCSTAKNTAIRRGFHQMKVKYNIYFNGNTAFLEGQQAIINANEDDYTHVLNLYPVSNHKAAESSASQMETTIEKCRKCIKLHSIQVKPKINPRKRNDPKYKLWLSQKEFNNQMGNAWIRLGEAEFHKGDFLGSIGTFSYIAKHYATDPDVVARCQLWMARAYSEIGWENEAEDMLNKTNVDNLNRKHAPFYAATYADILIKRQQYELAIPFVEKALPAEKRYLYKPRFQYVLGQLYELSSRKTDALAAFKKVIKMTPPIEMDFNARIKIAQLNSKKALKKLNSLSRLSKYNEKMDIIYGAIGDIYLEKKDTADALHYYHLAIDTSTQENYNKASILIKAGDVYYVQKKYREAQPLYKQASAIISPEHVDYDRITKLLEALDELIKEYETIHLQDSLQQLSKLTPSEQVSKVNGIIAQLKLKEQKEEEKAAQEARNNQNKNIKSVDTHKMFGDKNMDNSWYFYNEQLVRSGKSAFQSKWGNRPLEDNWRRTSKTMTTSFDTEEEDTYNENLLKDSTNSLSAKSNPNQPLDKYHPSFYLQQIPKNEKDFNNSDSLIRNALYDMIFTYMDKIEDFQAAQETFEEFIKRFPQDKKLPDLYFMFYMHCIKNEKEDLANYYKKELTTLYPKSKQAKVVSDPNYLTSLNDMAQEQDSLFEKTYSAFAISDFQQVQQNTKLALKNYSMSPLIPNFLLLDAIATARTTGQQPFVKKLKKLVADYPDSQSSAMAKTFLSLINEGETTKKGVLTKDLDKMRQQQYQNQDNKEEQQALADLPNDFHHESNTRSIVLFLTHKQDEKLLNSLLYEIALFNFSQFLIKDFDIKTSLFFGNQSAIQVIGFESLQETKWYTSLIVKNEKLSNFIVNNNIQIIPITQDNLKLINTKFTIEEYLKFYSQQNKP